MASIQDITVGTRVSTTKGVTGTVASEPTLFPGGHIVSVDYDPEFAHLSPIGGADFDVDDLTVIPVKQTTPCRQCGTWGDDTMQPYRTDMCGYCSDDGNVALVWADAFHGLSSQAQTDIPPYAREYQRYVSDGLADTDGYYAPESYEQWLKLEKGLTYTAPTDTPS